MEKQGNKIAERVLKRLRKIDGLENVPIMISLYREAKQGSPVPGNFVAKTTVPEGENSIGEWKSIRSEERRVGKERGDWGAWPMQKQRTEARCRIGEREARRYG